MRLKNINFTTLKINFLRDVDIDNILMSGKVFSGKKLINFLFITKMTIIKLNHPVLFFRKRLHI